MSRDRAGYASEANGPTLVRDADGLALSGGGQTLRGDFSRMLPRARPDRVRRELLVRAAKVRGTGEVPSAVDATAGLGEDAFLLAAAGFSVRLYERDPLVAALLEDALQRAREAPELAGIASRMELFEQDSLEALPRLGFLPDVVLLDPMFPAKRGDALAKKKLQLIQLLERPCADEEALLGAALAARPRKVVIKRPLKGPHLAGRKPDYSLCGRTIRYDCIVVPRG
jgi:16S rRNA (guanine1516-N2)-methyltransferase